MSPNLKREGSLTQARWQGRSISIDGHTQLTFHRQCFLTIEKRDNAAMKNYSAVVERDPDTGLLVGYVPGFPGAHSQAESLDEIQANLRELSAMPQEDGEPGFRVNT
jgi:hypothetical protein